MDEVVKLMEIMTYRSNYPAFVYNKNAIRDFRERMHVNLSASQLKTEVAKMMERSYDHTGTGLYDSFQVITNGIAK